VSVINWMFDGKHGAASRLLPRWIFLRALGLIYFSAFYSLVFQIKGLIGPDGILPARLFLAEVGRSLATRKFWFAPTLLWISSGPHMLIAICFAGMIASVLVVLNIWPRGMLFLCFVCFLSFVSAAQDFSGYQSDGMLLEAGFISLFFAPSGFRPGWGEHSPPARAALFLLLWEWFRIYFESGLVKLLSGDPEWRHLTAMDEYYQNGPLPTWIGWYLQHLPHWFHWLTALGTLVMELGLVLMLFLPRRFRIVLFFITTIWQVVVISTANYTFLNYLVLSLGFLLLDDRFAAPFIFRTREQDSASAEPLLSRMWGRASKPVRLPSETDTRPASEEMYSRTPAHALTVAITMLMLTWIFYATTAQLIWIVWRSAPLPTAPVAALEPFRIANSYGLFAVMTRGRYEIEFQGSNDGHTWAPYPYLYKPQALDQPPGIYAPYQPRFDWNLWFASLGPWRQNMFVVSTEERLLNNAPGVLALFRGNPFPNAAPKQVRAVLWQYWFTSMAEKRATGNWWTRQYLGTYAPTLTQSPDGRLTVLGWPDSGPKE
jgi:Lipase maturation factor